MTQNRSSLFLSNLSVNQLGLRGFAYGQISWDDVFFPGLKRVFCSQQFINQQIYILYIYILFVFNNHHNGRFLSRIRHHRQDCFWR